MTRLTRALAAAFICLLSSTVWGATRVRFLVTYPASAFDGKFSGRVVVYLTKGTRNEPRFGPNWFNPEPMYSAEFRNVSPGQAMVISDLNATGFPGRLSELEPGAWRVQAVVDRNLGGRTIGRSPGNLYSPVVGVQVQPDQDQEVSLTCDRVAIPPVFVETDQVKLLTIRSSLLSAFYGRPTYLRAAVAVPADYSADSKVKYPIVYEVPGFGGTHMGLSGRQSVPQTLRDGQPFLYVLLDPEAPTGHTVFADSANNGPWGRALIQELIPEVERRFRAVGSPQGRFVAGHSSGGWSSLWLQVTYPDLFGGTWSTAPDPVDFRDFQRIDLYAPNANMYMDAAGNARPIARMGQSQLMYRQFALMERPIRGEQLGSFEAVFSPRARNGAPLKLFDRDTGKVDPKIAEAWKRYDISLMLQRNWSSLKDKLAGKLHVYAAQDDTFFLEGAVKLLGERLKALGSDAKVELFPGNHGSMLTRELRMRVDKEMADAYRASLPPKTGQ